MTGEPTDWAKENEPPPADKKPVETMNMLAWARRWLNEQWIEWQPRSRRSALEGIAQLVSLAGDTPAMTAHHRSELRLHLQRVLPPNSDVPPDR
jgi:hypothetical protein